MKLGLFFTEETLSVWLSYEHVTKQLAI